MIEAKNRIKIVLAEQNQRATVIVKKLGVSKTTVSRWVNNTQQPTLENLYRIAFALDVSVRALLVDNKKNQPTDSIENPN